MQFGRLGPAHGTVWRAWGLVLDQRHAGAGTGAGPESHVIDVCSALYHCRHVHIGDVGGTVVCIVAGCRCPTSTAGILRVMGAAIMLAGIALPVIQMNSDVKRTAP